MIREFFSAKMARSLLAVVCFLFIAQSAYASAIMGTIYDRNRTPIPEVNIELLNDLYQTINRTITDATGRYEFADLPDGRYTVKVLPLRHDLMEQSQLVEIYTSTVRGQGNGYIMEIKDFVLLPRKGSLDEAEAGVVFAQDIPKDAKKAYESALESFTKAKRTEGINSLKTAIKIFPNFFLALLRLGKEYSIEAKYGDAFPLLLKAADINAKSPTAFYFLGYALYKLGYYPSALIALSQAYVLSPSSVPLLWALGAVERHENKLADAEKHLTQAKKLTRIDIPDLNFELALLYRDLKKYDLAANELEAFLKARPDAKDAEKIKNLIKDYRSKAKS